MAPLRRKRKNASPSTRTLGLRRRTIFSVTDDFPAPGGPVKTRSERMRALCSVVGLGDATYLPIDAHSSLSCMRPGRHRGPTIVDADAARNDQSALERRIVTSRPRRHGSSIRPGMEQWNRRVRAGVVESNMMPRMGMSKSVGRQGRSRTPRLVVGRTRLAHKCRFAPMVLHLRSRLARCLSKVRRQTPRRSAASRRRLT